MIAYLDPSVLLRLVLGEPSRLLEWGRLEAAVASFLVEVECLRTLDRLRLRGDLTPLDLATRRAAVFKVLESIELVDVSRPILGRAGEPFPTPLGTLDAIHLATALAWKTERESPLVMATHDGALALAAKASGLEVVGS